ncbi:MAG: hypothetical protein ACRC34_03815 [Cetobacterium sp.]
MINIDWYKEAKELGSEIAKNKLEELLENRKSENKTETFFDLLRRKLWS